MAIEDIFKALEEQADSEVNQILHAATVQADTLEHEARDEAERIIRTRIAAAEEAVRMKAAKALNAARLQVRRDQASVRDSAVDAVFEKATLRLAGLRGTKEYERVFAALAQEAFAGTSGECELLVAPEDAELATKVVAELKVACTLSPTLESIGGLVVAMNGGRVVRRNTFESRLDKVRGLAGAKVAEVLNS
ncbi:MAG: V-type ATP synthase subunit E [Coriobacteriia bacterium]